MNDESQQNPTIQLLRRFSIPLIAGVVAALAWANVHYASYHALIHYELLGHGGLHFLTNDIFMGFFFGIAAVEIVVSIKPGGPLNPPSKAINPLLASGGGIIGPIVVYLILNRLIGGPELQHGWGIPTATDIALAWLVARLALGKDHPAVLFLLLLAIVDDAVGLVIIAVFYPDSFAPAQPIYLVLVGLGVFVAFLLRKRRVNNYWAYLIFGGTLTWSGLSLAHLHPALALVFIVPFMPHRVYGSRENVFDEALNDQSALGKFEHQWKVIVDFGMFIFGLTNAGVKFSSVGAETWLVLISLVIGKTVGIFALGVAGQAMGFPLPTGVGKKELLLTGLIASIGLTVAIFVANEAFSNQIIQGEAKMGALLSGLVAVPAIGFGKWLVKAVVESAVETAVK